MSVFFLAYERHSKLHGSLGVETLNLTRSYILFPIYVALPTRTYLSQQQNTLLSVMDCRVCLHGPLHSDSDIVVYYNLSISSVTFTGCIGRSSDVYATRPGKVRTCCTRLYIPIRQLQMSCTLPKQQTDYFKMLL